MPNPRRPPQKKNLVALVGRTRAQHSLRLAARNYRTWIAAVAYGSPVYACLILCSSCALLSSSWLLHHCCRLHRTWIAAVAYGSPVYCMIDIIVCLSSLLLSFVIILAAFTAPGSPPSPTGRPSMY